MRIVAFLFRSFPARLSIAAGFGLLAGASASALVAIILAAIQASSPRPRSLLLLFILGIAARTLFRLVAQAQLEALGQQAIRRIRGRLAMSALHADPRRIEAIGMPRLAGALTEETQSIAEASGSLSRALIAVGTIAAILIYIVIVSPFAAALIVATTAVGLVLQRQLARRSLRLDAEREARREAMFAELGGVVAGFSELKLDARRRRGFIGEVEAAVDSFHDSLYRSFALWGWVENTQFSIYLLAIGGVAFGAAAMGAPQSGATEALIAALYLAAPVADLVGSVPTIALAESSLNSLRELGLELNDESSSEKDKKKPTSLDAFKRIELRDVVLTYRAADDDRKFSVGPIHLALLPGQIVFVVGGNGSGKTSLMKILCGLYRPDSGEIFLDDKRTEDDPAGYRSLFGIVFADGHVFSSIVRGEDQTRRIHAAKLLQRMGLEEHVTIRDDGQFSTTRSLSTGQKKRLALVAALVEDRPVYLLDEWAAEQDPSFKRYFYTELLPELRAAGKTIVAVSHDDRYFHVADRVIVMNEGRIVKDESQ